MKDYGEAVWGRQSCLPTVGGATERIVCRTRAGARKALLLLALLAACARESPEETAALQKFLHGFSTRYPGEQVTVGVSKRRVMTVAFINTPLLSAPKATRQARARDAADLVRKTYPRLGEVDMIYVDFVERKGTLVTTTHTVDYYRYPK